LGQVFGVETTGDEIKNHVFDQIATITVKRELRIKLLGLGRENVAIKLDGGRRMKRR